MDATAAESKAGLRYEDVSKIFRLIDEESDESGGLDWTDVETADYKPPEDESWRGVSRRELVGTTGESTAFHLRYFEIEPGGYTTLEEHDHTHTVVVLRGQGRVVIGDAVREVGFGDVVYVAPRTAHQFRNEGTHGPFGFLCIVDAERDRPDEVSPGQARRCSICE